MKSARARWILGSALLLASAPSRAAEPVAPEQTSIHYQATTAAQAHPAFDSPYVGANSLPGPAEGSLAFVTTFFVDARLWRGADYVFNPEMSGGSGLGRTLGVAAFPSGIAYRVGDPAPSLYIARVMLRQRFGLGGGVVEEESAPNKLAGRHDRDALTIQVGRFSVTDVFDGNAYAHDATSQFFNWALFAAGAWDYPADTRGYTWGAAADLSVSWWSIRAGVAMEPVAANERQLDTHLDKAHGLVLEGEARYALGQRKGATRLLLYANTAHMGSYAQVLADPARYDNDVVNTRAYGRWKYGASVSADQEITSWLGAFLRASVNDGATETWAFTEIDRSLGAGLVLTGTPYERPHDHLGAAGVLNGLSPDHRRYLEGGGLGFIIGDGELRYAPELEGEVYYDAEIVPHLALAGIYQQVVNPAYNEDRGPVHVFTARVRVSF